MIVIKPALSAEASVRLEKLKLLDLLPIIAYLIHSKEGYKWTLSQAYHAVKRYKTFLFVSYLYPEILLIPTLEIDQVWHVHILHTRKYRKDCEFLFGHLIDHEPSFEFEEAEEKNFDAAFAQTQALLALFEGYFNTTDSWNTLLPQADRSKLAINQPQLGNKGEKNLVFSRSACGRLKTGK